MFKSGSKFFSVVIGITLLSGCSNLSDVDEQMPLENRHLNGIEEEVQGQIPNVVRPLPAVSAPQVEAPLELYSVVVQDVSVRELLFAMARDANINIDVHSSVNGNVSINAIDQTLPQILDRIARQIDIIWGFERQDYLVVELDVPVLRNYHIDYVNISRGSTSDVFVSTAVTGGVDSGGGEESNNSTTQLTQSSANDFWVTLEANLSAIIGETAGENEASSTNIIINPESSLATVRATQRQHVQVFDFIESVRTRALYQVLIEATIVEVELNDRFQSGVNWDLIDRDNGQINFSQNLTGLNLITAPTNVLTIDKSAGPDAVTATVRLLNQFGDAKVLSSPRLMALNNQTAMLRVVDSRIYFTIEVEAGTAASPAGPAIPPTFTSEVHTVPVGFTMAVTPQISANNEVTLNVRPTISRILRFVNDPNPALADAGVVNEIPEIQIREIESILKVNSGDIAVLGGLMQDTIGSDVAGLTGFNRLPFIGDFFNYRDDEIKKSELIIFIRPVVISNASTDGDFENYREFLPTESLGESGLRSSARSF